MFSNFKKRLGVLTAIAVMAALVPALAASPASAAVALTPTAAGDGALYSACPAGSAAAGGFTDTTSTDVDCIKMHGITTGVTATTYEPASNIPRWQMALYLTRFATAAGVTLGSGADQGFTDISGYSAAIQTAINQIKQLGVTTGTTATTYSPDDNVTREQMAMFVERMLSKTVAGPGGNNASASYSGLVGTGSTLTYNYTDIDSGGVTFEGHNAIAEIYHLGIPGHAKTVTTFSPAAAITRADMATWMTNALAHTNARPAGVWTQVTGASANTGFGTKAMTLHISHRDANRAAVPGTLIDIFSDVTAANTDPFSATTGLCTATNTVELGNTGGDECKVDLGDVSTDAHGNIGGSAGTAGGDVTAATTSTYWAYTAATGTSFNNLTMTANTVSRSQATAAGYVKLGSTIPLNNVMDGTDAAFEMVKYGTSVTMTATAKTSATGTVVAGAFGVKVVDTVIALADNGNAGDITNAAGDVTTSVTTTTGTMTDGVWTHDITQADPTPVGTALSSTLSRTQTTSVVTADLSGDGTYETSVGTISISWDDNAAAAKSSTLTEGSYWGVGLALASGGVARTATATVYDQYGSGVANHAVAFTGACASGSTDCGESFVDASSRTTNSVGVATLSYTDLLTATGIETTSATPSGLSASTSTYYRIDGTTGNHAEVDGVNADGAVVGTSFANTTGDVWTFVSDHGLSDGDAIIITIIGASMVCSPTCPAGDLEYFIVKETGSARAVKLYTTRSVSALGAVSYSGLLDVTTATTDTAGRAEMGDADGGLIVTGDEYMEVMVNDAANDRFVAQRKVSAASYTYHAFTYDSGDQFNVYADGTGLNSSTPASMATFQTHLAAKMNAVTGAPGAGFNGDVFGITYTNANAGGGVSVFSLGS